jgi:hypothetical protein
MKITTIRMPGRLLTPQALKVYRHMSRTGSISARDAMDDYSMTSAVLTRRICDLEAEGFGIIRVRKTHPINGLRYTRYELAA